jgi:hypothetical protein
VEVRTGKMASAHKIAVLRKIKREKGVFWGSFSKDLTKQKNVRNGRSDGAGRVNMAGNREVVAVVSRHSVVKLKKEDIGK